MGLRARLLTGFCGIALMSLVVGIVGITNMNRINESSSILYENEMLGLSLVQKANLDVMIASRAEKNCLLAVTQEDFDTEYASWAQRIANASGYLKQVESKFRTEEGKKQLQVALDAFAAWEPLTTEVVELARGSIGSTDKGEALALSNGDALVKIKALDAAIAALVARKEENGKTANLDTASIYRTSFIIMLVLTAVGMLIGIAVGIWQSGSVLKAVGGEPEKIAGIADRIAAADLAIDTSQAAKTTGIHHALLVVVDRLSDIVMGMQGAAYQVSEGSQQLSSTSQEMSQGATEQAASVEEISSSMEQMTSNIKQNAENASTTGKIAQKSAQIADEGGKAVMKTVEAMKQIASKISIIEEIARSTNMLALNASIEAARAGEYGKGFAVVASEVGKLAERSQKESAEINALSTESVKIAEQAGATIQGMLPDIKRTAELVQEISAASNEQDSGAEQINKAIMQLDQVVQQNASASEESASMSEELASQAEQMQDAMSVFKVSDSRNHAAVRAEKKAVADTRRATVAPARKDPASPATASRAPAQKPKGITLHLDDEPSKSSASDAQDSEFKEF